MCGRYTLTSSAGLAEAFELLRGEPLEQSEWWRPRFNLAPTQPAPIVTNHDGVRSLELARWGLLPPWSTSRSGPPVINARAETIGESRPFRDAIRRRRCLVPADGFFEWRRETATKKSPVWLHPEPRRLVAFAGVWERWRAPEGWLVSFAIVTTKPNALVAPIHNRMPVVLQPSEFARWLDPTQQEPAGLRDLWEPIDVADWIATDVSPLVNKVAHDEPPRTILSASPPVASETPPTTIRPGRSSRIACTRPSRALATESPRASWKASDEAAVDRRRARGTRTHARALGARDGDLMLTSLEIENFKGIGARQRIEFAPLTLLFGANVERREDVLFLGPPGTGKSHLAQALALSAIQQGHRVRYREAHVLLEELADATLERRRKEVMTDLATVPLLVIDDLGMRKLPTTAAEDLLELIMRRYERASTLLTSNRPVEDWGKLLGDTAAVSALLDRLLHHAHVIQCGPRSWRTHHAANLPKASAPQ